MPDGFSIPLDVLPPVALLEELQAASDLTDRARLMRQLEAVQENARVLLPKFQSELRAYYSQVAGGNATWEQLLTWVSLCKTASEIIRLELNKIEGKLSGANDTDNAEIRHVTLETLNLGSVFLASIKEIENKLAKLAADRRGTRREVLCARPVAGNVDYAELIREHMARYPKIGAALAK